MRSREIITISSGPIRFLRRASRSSATVFASTPALRAPRAAVFAVPLAALVAVRLRAVALPPLLAAALREAALRLEADFALAGFAPLVDFARVADLALLAGFAFAAAGFAFAVVLDLLELVPLRFCAITHSLSLELRTIA
jgi:hypothetical protein